MPSSQRAGFLANVELSDYDLSFQWKRYGGDRDPHIVATMVSRQKSRCAHIGRMVVGPGKSLRHVIARLEEITCGREVFMEPALVERDGRYLVEVSTASDRHAIDLGAAEVEFEKAPDALIAGLGAVARPIVVGALAFALLSITEMARAEPCRQERQVLQLGLGCATAWARVGASDVPTADGARSSSNWVGLDAGVGLRVSDSWRMDAGIRSALARGDAEISLSSPPYPPGSVRPLQRFGAWRLDGTWQVRDHLGLRLSLASGVYGSLRRGPLAAARFANTEWPGGRRDDGRNWAYGVQFAARIPYPRIASVDIVIEPGVLVHTRSTIRSGAYADDILIALPLAFELARPDYSVRAETGVWTSADGPVIPALLESQLVAFDAVALGTRVGIEFHQGAPFDRAYFLGISLSVVARVWTPETGRSDE